MRRYRGELDANVHRELWRGHIYWRGLTTGKRWLDTCEGCGVNGTLAEVRHVGPDGAVTMLRFCLTCWGTRVAWVSEVPTVREARRLVRRWFASVKRGKLPARYLDRYCQEQR